MGTHRKCCCDITELDCPCPVYPTWCFGWQGWRGYGTDPNAITQTNGRWTPLWYTSPYYDSRTSLSWQIGLTLYNFNNLTLDGTSVYEKPPQGGVPGATYCAFNEPARTSVANNPAGSQDFPFRLPPKPSSSDNDWCIPYNYPAPEWIGTGGRPGNNNNEVTIIWPIVNAEQPQDFSDWDVGQALNQYCCADFLIDEVCTTTEREGFKNADKLCLGFEIQGNSSLLEEMWSGLSGIGFGTNGVLGSLLGNATSIGRWAKRVYSENGGALKALRFFADPNVWGYNVATTTAGGRGILGPFRLMDGAAMRPSGTWNNHRAIFTHTNWGKENGIDPVFRNCYCNTSWPEAGSCTTQEIEVTFNPVYDCGETDSIIAKWPVPLVDYPIGTGCKYASNKVNLYTTYANPEPVYPTFGSGGQFTQAYCDASQSCGNVSGGTKCNARPVNVSVSLVQARVGCRGLYQFQSYPPVPCDGFASIIYGSENYEFGECNCDEVIVDCEDCNLPCPPDPNIQCLIETADGGTEEPSFFGGLGGPGGGPGGGGPGGFCGTLENPCECLDDPFDSFPPGPCKCFMPGEGEGPNTCCCGGFASLAEKHNCFDVNGQIFPGKSPTCACIAENCANWPDCGPICGYCKACSPCCSQEQTMQGWIIILFDIRSNGAGPKLSSMEPYNIRVYSGFTEQPIDMDVQISFKDQPNYIDPYDGRLRDFGCFDPVPINGGVGCFSLDSKDYNHPFAFCNYTGVPTDTTYRFQ
jgi:hypothetical protein